MDVNDEKIQELLFINKNLKNSNFELNEEITCLENSFSLINQEKEHLSQKYIKLRTSFESSIIENVNELNTLKCKYSEINKHLQDQLTLKENEIRKIIKESNQLKNEIHLKDDELNNLKKNLITLEKRLLFQKHQIEPIKNGSELNLSCQNCSKQIDSLKKEIEVLKQEKAKKVKKMVDEQKFVEDIKEVYRLAGMEVSQFEGESVYSIKKMDQAYFADAETEYNRYETKNHSNYNFEENKFVQDIKKIFILAGVKLSQFNGENNYSLKEIDKDYLLESLLSTQKKVIYLPNQVSGDDFGMKKKVEKKHYVKPLKCFNSFFKLIIHLFLFILTIFYLLITTILILGRSGYLSSAYYPYLIRQKVSSCE